MRKGHFPNLPKKELAYTKLPQIQKKVGITAFTFLFSTFRFDEILLTYFNTAID